MIARWVTALSLVACAVGAGATAGASTDTTTPESTSPESTSPESSPAGSTPVDDTVDDTPTSFPGAEWATAPLPADVDQAVIDAAVEAAFGPADVQTGTTSVLLVQDGAIVYERYHPLSGPDTIFHSFGIARGFTAALVGVLVGDGLMDIDRPAPVAEWQAADDPRGTITPRQLLDSTSGLAWSPEDLGPLVNAVDGPAVAVAAPLVSEPGTVLNFSEGSTAVLVGLARDAVGGCAELTTYLRQRVIDPIGITTADLLTDGLGCWRGYMGANMTARDFARLGVLFANDGVWADQQVLPAGWVDEVRTPSMPNPYAGLHWYVDEADGLMWVEGLLGQILIVAPEADLVLAINANGGDFYALANVILGEYLGVAI